MLVRLAGNTKEEEVRLASRKQEKGMVTEPEEAEAAVRMERRLLLSL